MYPDWIHIHYTAKDDSDPQNLLLPSLCPVYEKLGMEPRTSCMLGKHATNKAPAQAPNCSCEG